MLPAIPAKFVARVCDDAREFHAHRIKDVHCKGYDGVNGMSSRLLAFTDTSIKIVEIGNAHGDEGCLWTVEVQYAASGACALYGVKANGDISLWAN